MKLIRLLLITSTFLIMVSAILNLLNALQTNSAKTGIYIELLVMFLLTIIIVLVNGQEKKLKDKRKRDV